VPRTAWQVMSAPVGAAQNARACTAKGRVGNPIAPPGGEGNEDAQYRPGRRMPSPRTRGALYPAWGVRTYDRLVMLAGIPVRDQDVRKLADLLGAGGFEDVAHKLDHALFMETTVWH